MTRPSGTARGVWTLLAISSAIAAVGCGPELDPPDPSNPLPPGVQSDTGKYREQIAEFPMTRNSHTRHRKAKCFLGLCSGIDVRIEALGNTLAIDPENAPETAVAVAHLVNLDRNKKEKFYGLLPGNEAEYDLWVSRRPGSNKAQWTLVQRSLTSGAVTAAQPRYLDYCHLRGPNDPTVSDADFAENQNHGACDQPIIETAQGVSRASLFPTSVFSALLGHVTRFFDSPTRTQGGWIDCARGCCT
jgi:hypothetical protein